MKLAATLLPICPLQLWSYKLSVFANRCLVVTWKICSPCKAVLSASWYDLKYLWTTLMKWNKILLKLQFSEYVNISISTSSCDICKTVLQFAFADTKNMVHKVEWIKKDILNICNESQRMSFGFVRERNSFYKPIRQSRSSESSISILLFTYYLLQVCNILTIIQHGSVSFPKYILLTFKFLWSSVTWPTSFQTCRPASFRW